MLWQKMMISLGIYFQLQVFFPPKVFPTTWILVAFCLFLLRFPMEITMLNFTRSWGFGIFRVYWVSKSKCIISSNLRAEGSSGKVLNVVIFVESVVHRSNWRSRETETVGNSRKQSEAVGNSRERPGVIMPKLSIRNFFAKKNCARNPIFFLKVQRETVGNGWGSYLWLGKKRAI